MMPMLRTLFRSVSTSSATPIASRFCRSAVFGGWADPNAGASDPGRPRPPRKGGRSRPESPAVVREGLVGLGHLVSVLAALDRSAEAVAGVEDLVHQLVGHRLL